MLQFRYFVRKILKLTFILLIVISVLSLGVFEFFQPFRYFTWMSLFFFLLLTLFSGYYNSRSIGKPFFINIFLGTLAVKFFLSLAFIVAYFLIFEPANKLIVIPYLLLFSIYKLFETVMLIRYSKKPVSDAEASTEP